MYETISSVPSQVIAGPPSVIAAMGSVARMSVRDANNRPDIVDSTKQSSARIIGYWVTGEALVSHTKI